MYFVLFIIYNLTVNLILVVNIMSRWNDQIYVQAFIHFNLTRKKNYLFKSGNVTMIVPGKNEDLFPFRNK